MNCNLTKLMILNCVRIDVNHKESQDA